MIGIDCISMYVISYHIARSVINSQLKCVFSVTSRYFLVLKGSLVHERNSSKEKKLPLRFRWRLLLCFSFERKENYSTRKHDNLTYYECTGSRSGFWDFSLHWPSIEVSVWKLIVEYFVLYYILKLLPRYAWQLPWIAFLLKRKIIYKNRVTAKEFNIFKPLDLQILCSKRWFTRIDWPQRNLIFLNLRFFKFYARTKMRVSRFISRTISRIIPKNFLNYYIFLKCE